MPEEREVRKFLESQLAIELIACGYPVECNSDVTQLRDAIAQGEITVVTADRLKMVSLNAAIEVLQTKVDETVDEITAAMLCIATDLQVSILGALIEQS